MWKTREIKENAVHKSMLKVLEGRDVLFLENDMGLHNSVGNLEFWLRENKLKYNALYNINDLNMEYIKGQIEYSDIIAFQTTWTYEVSRKIQAFLESYKIKKIIVECYISEPSWFYKPKGIAHDMFVLDSHDEDMDEWDFKKLRLNKATWEK